MFFRRQSKVYLFTGGRAKTRRFIKKAFYCALLLVFLLLLYKNSGGVYASAKNMLNDEDRLKTAFFQVLPLSSIDGSGSGINQGSGLESLVYAVTGVRTGEPRAILGAELNLSTAEFAAGAVFRTALTIEEEGGEEDFFLPEQEEDIENWLVLPEDGFPPVQLNGEPMILVYNTHNAETYKPSDGTSRVEGKNGGVADVAQALSSAMERKHSIKTLYSSVIHDYPDWAKSYVNSMQTVKRMLEEYPSIQMVVDIHRDAGLALRSDTLVKIGDKSCAKVMIVIGKEHPRWKENLAFAERIEKHANKMYPGLIKCIRVCKDRRYNQQFHSRALLFEFGSDLNTREDALNSAEMMADVFAAVLKEK